MADGASKTLYDHRPCRRCGGRVKLIGGRCDDCDQKHLRPQPGPQTDFLACKADIALTGGSMGSGKLLPLSEPVPTPHGWLTVGELKVGSVIFGEHGQHVKVTHLHPIDLGPESYRITFNDGATIEACAEHLWPARGTVLPTKLLRPMDPMPVAAAVDGPCRIDVPSYRHRIVTSVEPCGPVPMRCITVDNPTGLWLVGRRHLVTHNTFSLLLDWGRYINTPGANGLIVRNRATDITVGGGLWDEARNVYDGTGARPRGGSLMDMTWPSGAKLSFRHLDDRNVERFKGPGFSWIAFEEVNECPWDAVMWLLSRNRSTCGARPVVRMSTNPDPDHPILDLVDPYLFLDPDHPLYGYPDRSKSGMVVYLIRGSDDRFIIGNTPEEVAAKTDSDPALALSFSFIPSLLEDNRALAETDPKYRAKFGAMTAVDRARNERGNWKIRAQVHGMIRLHWIPVIERPLAPILHRVRAWDMASTRPGPKNKDPDFTIGMLIGWDIHGRWYVMDMVACREEAPEVLKLMAATAASDGPDVTQVIEIEGGAAGKHSEMQWTGTLRSSGRCGPVVSVSRLGDKVVKVTPVADQLRLGMNGNRPRVIDYEQDPTGVWVPRGFQTGTWRAKPYKDAGQHPPTLGALFDQQVEAFFRPDVHDDVPDAMAIAHAARQQPKVKYEDPVQRMIRQS